MAAPRCVFHLFRCINRTSGWARASRSCSITQELRLPGLSAGLWYDRSSPDKAIRQHGHFRDFRHPGERRRWWRGKGHSTTPSFSPRRGGRAGRPLPWPIAALPGFVQLDTATDGWMPVLVEKGARRRPAQRRRAGLEVGRPVPGRCRGRPLPAGAELGLVRFGAERRRGMRERSRRPPYGRGRIDDGPLRHRRRRGRPKAGRGDRVGSGGARPSRRRHGKQPRAPAPPCSCSSARPMRCVRGRRCRAARIAGSDRRPAWSA